LSLPERIASFPVVLRPLRLADAPLVSAYCADRELAQMTAVIPHPYLPGMAEAFIAACTRQREAGASFCYAITGATDGVLVGAIELRADEDDSLGYWVGRPHQGHGYATAAARALVALAFSQLDRDRVSASHLAVNPASGRVLEKCGMTLVRRELRPHRGEPRESHCIWSIDVARWTAVRDADAPPGPVAT
jgi:ribosomal-protein-alanine N-acetyltransferase